MGVADARTTEPETESLSPVRRRFTVDEYHRMIEAGILGEDEHVELLEGEILEMSPQSERHLPRILARQGRAALGRSAGILIPSKASTARGSWLASERRRLRPSSPVRRSRGKTCSAEI
jgi:hypothetical protein